MPDHSGMKLGKVDYVKMGMKRRQGKWNGGSALGYKSVENRGQHELQAQGDTICHSQTS